MSASVSAAYRISNALTIDVEDYFQVSAFAPYIDRSAWETTPCRIERNIDRILELLDQRGAKATFFTLGWLAQRYPRLVREVSEQGHEVASHGQAHRRASDQSPAEFDDDIRAAKKLLEDTTGVAVRGYRAPSFSIGHGNLWAFDRIAAAGYRYSSSVYPVQHDHYGMPDAPRFPYRVSNGLLEIPVSTARVFGRNLPAGGGGYFRLAPYRAVALGDRSCQSSRPTAGDFLFPSMGDRSAAAAYQGRRFKDPFPALRQSESDGQPPTPIAERLSLGPNGSRF